MSGTPRRSPALVLVSLCGLAGVVIAFSCFLLMPPPIVTGVVRNDRVAGPGNKQYRRLMRVERRRGTITTTVSFTEIATGGVGRATFIQPDLPRIPRWQSLVDWGRTRLALPFPLTRADLREMPRMAIPDPMQPGEKWIVRLNVYFSGYNISGRGKRPKRATIDEFPSIMNPSLNPLIDQDSSIVYGERILFPYQ